MGIKSPRTSDVSRSTGGRAPKKVGARALRWAFLAAGVLMAAALIPLVMAGGDVHSATYKGSKVCLMCHKATNKPIAEAYPKTSHALAFWQVGQEPEGQKVLGDFSKGPGFSLDQVAYVLGAGSFEQAYLDKQFQLLIPMWNVPSQSWISPQPSVDGATQCVACHVTGYDLSAKTWQEPGVGCESCHGPGSEHIASADKKGSIVRPQTLDPLREAMICGQCHSLGQDKSGPHPNPVAYRPGDDLAETFVDAQPTEHVPHAAPPWSQYSEWLQSKHASASPPVTCTKCHEPHGVGSLPHEVRKEGTALCLDCHDTLTGPDHAPASLQEATCVSCHMPQGSHFFPKTAK